MEGSLSSLLDCEELAGSFGLLHQHVEDFWAGEGIFDKWGIVLEGRDDDGSNWFDIFGVSFFDLVCSVFALKDCIIRVGVDLAKFELLHEIIAGFEVESVLMAYKLDRL